MNASDSGSSRTNSAPVIAEFNFSHPSSTSESASFILPDLSAKSKLMIFAPVASTSLAMPFTISIVPLTNLLTPFQTS